MKYEPHEYQTYCSRFIRTHEQACLFLDMGLGKTVTTLTAIKGLFDEGKVSKVLIIAPLRVARDTWPDEIEKWDHLKGLSYSRIIGGKVHRQKALSALANIYLVNRENVADLVEMVGSKWNFDMVVIDELSSFKSPRAKRFKALKSVRNKTKRWVGLTGTPAANGLLDLWPEMYLIDGGQRLGKYVTRFREAYFRVAAKNPYTGVVYKYTPRPGAEEQIYEKISDIVVSMKAIDHLDMPELTFIDERVKLSTPERATYEALRKDMIVDLGDTEIVASNAGTLIGKLAQMANGAIYGEEHEVKDIHSRKLERLEELIEQANGQPVLVAYWFKHDRSRIIEYLTEKNYTDIRGIDSSEDIRDWNNGKIPIALIHPASAGHGLNIQSGGHILIWFSLTWSLELYQQTNARLWRQGQKNQVSIYHIVTENSVDEDILKALKDKDVTQKRLIQAVKARL